MNLAAGILHTFQGLLMLYLANDYSVELTTTFLKNTGDNTFPRPETEVFGNFYIAPAVALFMFISAFFHFLISSNAGFDSYKENLKKGMNYFRWVEYSISASVMIVVIGALSGIYDVPSLVMLFSLNATMIMFGWLMELHNQTTKNTDWTSFIFGCLAGMVPWLVIFWYFFSAIGSAGSDVPDFLYGIIISLFLLFNIFALNMYFQYHKVGAWRNYLFGEKMYIILSLVAKSALAWQVFFGTLR